jgi:hypothetical protein
MTQENMTMKKKQKPESFDARIHAAAFAGLSVIRPALKDAGVPVNPVDYEPRTPEERVIILSPRMIQTDAGQVEVRQVAVWPSNRNAKSKPTQEIGLVECRESGEVFYLWSHVAKVGLTFIPKVYDLAPELLMETFARSQASRDSMPDDLRAQLGFVG